MIVLEQSDYEKLAEDLVQQYHTGVPLNDGIYKLAMDMGLNPNQIKQLVWSTNVNTHLSLFQKAAEDKMIEFPVADADYVIKRLYTPPEEQPLPAKLASDAAMDFYSPLAPTMEKIAEASDYAPEEKPISAKTAADRKAKSILSARKVAEEMDMRRLASAHEAAEGIHSLIWDVRRIDFDRAEFEKDAFAIHGEEALLPLNWLRELSHMEKAASEQLTSSHERVVETASTPMKKFAEIISKLAEVRKYTQAISWFKDKLKDQ